MTSLFAMSLAHGQTSPDPPGYRPDTPPWVRLIDECMAGGGLRNDCIEALPPQIYADFLAWERSRYAERLALGELPRAPWVPRPEDLPDIYSSPLSVPDIPVEVAESLVASGCLIPKSLSGRSNVVTGEFAAAGQQDIAVICSVDGISQIKIFWGGPASCPSLNSSSPDWTLLYRTVEWEYYWAISISSPAHIRHYYDNYPEECRLEDLPRFEHDGLADIMEEKASSNLYCHEGRWLHLCGSD